MSIRFECEKCGMPMEAEPRLVGKRGHCKHCGQEVIVPSKDLDGDQESAVAIPAQQPALQLKKLYEPEPEPIEKRLLAPGPDLTVKHATEDPKPKPKMISDPDSLANEVEAGQSSRGRKSSVFYKVTDPHGFTRSHSSAGPPPFLMLIPTLTARYIAHILLLFREWLYVVSIGGLVAVLIGYLFYMRLVLHFGAVVVVASNISMLCVGVAYLVTFPFKESLRHGLANLLIPFYAVYYWSSRWNRMKRPVTKTIGSFLPIALVGLAYLVYKESPKVQATIENGLPGIEKTLEGLDPVKGALDSPSEEPTTKPESKIMKKSRDDDPKRAPEGRRNQDPF